VRRRLLFLIVALVCAAACQPSRPDRFGVTTTTRRVARQDVLGFVVDETDRPRVTDPAPAPLGQPAAVPAPSDQHRFLYRQSGSSRPVAYDPCREVRVVVNERTMPAGAENLLREALRTLGTATGLRFGLEGPTTEEPSIGRPVFQPLRYGDRWAPVLVAWSDPPESEALMGEVDGAAGSALLTVKDGERVYITGVVLLDGPQLEKSMKDHGLDRARWVILHELGHLVGLDHVADPAQVMSSNPAGGVTDYGAGDLTGLAALGQGGCFRS
jgi:hypothetical protein